jgi:alkylation response protein AidB-like acyl-CoA dehydrogenase
MDFRVGEEVEMLRQTLRRFVSEEVIPLERRHELTWDVAPPKELRREVRLRAKRLGLYGLDMPREVGGGGPTPILLSCTKEQRRRYVYPLVAGEITTCFALSEARGRIRHHGPSGAGGEEERRPART